MRKRLAKYYFVESYGAWLVVKAYNKKDARLDASNDLGFIKTIRIATPSEIEEYKRQKQLSEIRMVEP